MNGPAAVLIRAYRGALRLYPGPVQAEYGSEMASVFAQSCLDAAQSSIWALCVLGLRELRDLPINLVREHGSAWRRKRMAPHSGLPETVRQSIGRAVLIFGACFALVYLVYALLDTLLNGGHLLWQRDSLWNLLIIHPTAVASGLGVALLGRPSGWRRAWASALVVFLSYILFFRATRFIFSAPPTDIFGYVVLPTLFQTVTGLIVGSLTGWIQRGRRSAGSYALAGALGFNLGWLVDRVSATGVLFLSPLQGYLSMLVVGSPWYFVYFFVPSLLYGLGVGLCLGVADSLKESKLARMFGPKRSSPTPLS